MTETDAPSQYFRCFCTCWNARRCVNSSSQVLPSKSCSYRWLPIVDMDSSAVSGWTLSVKASHRSTARPCGFHAGQTALGYALCLVRFAFSLTLPSKQCSVLIFLAPTTIHSFRSLSYNRSITSSKASSPQSAICYFLFQFPIFFGFLRVILYLLASYSFSALHVYPSFYLLFSNVFQKTVST